MLDLKFVRSNPELVRDSLRKRGESTEILDTLLACDERRRAILVEAEELKRQRNEASAEVGRMKQTGEDASSIVSEMRMVSERIRGLDQELSEVEMRLAEMLLGIPNIPHESVPVGRDESENVVVRKWGEPTAFDFEAKAHWDIGTDLDILDFERASKITGSRFVIYKGAGSKLVRALINFMLDLHTQEHGYTEVFPPFLINRDSAVGTGQLPKFAEDMFKCEGLDYYLAPTAEVPVTNMYRGEILPGDLLPIKHCAYTACFRSEAGSAGRDTRGLIRQHQFDKVELVKFVHPDTSYDELERLVNDAESILQLLNLPYQVTMMCTGDVGFSAAKKYDLEVWMPSYDRYVEISSCSNFEAFQARRADIRFRPAPGERAEFVHTLNGSGLAVGRTIAAMLENWQQPDGSVTIPPRLRGYMGKMEAITV
ncbi:MAG: serine--tRNA ligase [Bacillota bacterium]|nr:serine--tRNA ligase [Bacillota bacterium]HOL52551.1 serine--tRNA ligase [Bacillota bacterium]HPQ03046.1 serine--tRNA ligase [Bacillota bacterium]